MERVTPHKIHWCVVIAYIQDLAKLTAHKILSLK